MTAADGFMVAFGAVMGYVAAGLVLFVGLVGAFSVAYWLASRRR